MDSCNIFLPYNFTVQDQKAVDFVKRFFASRDDAEVVLFHAYTPLPNIDMARSTIMADAWEPTADDVNALMLLAENVGMVMMVSRLSLALAMVKETVDGIHHVWLSS